MQCNKLAIDQEVFQLISLLTLSGGSLFRFCLVFAACCWFMVPLVASQIIANSLNNGS
jgi:hypothetical protein